MRTFAKIVLSVVLVTELLGLVALSSLVGLKLFVLSPARDMAVAMIADRLAGERIPLDAPHSYDALFKVYDTTTNSKLMGEWAYEIVPFFAIENISNGDRYPRTIILAPNAGPRSFVVAGSAYCEERAVWLNDRFLEDRAQLFVTLAHELIHLQMGNFCDAPEMEEADQPLNRSVWIESHTTAATVEATAAMCQWGNPVACKAFWQEIATLARRSVQAKMMRAHALWFYYWWVNTAMINYREDAQADKIARLWAPNLGELQGLVDRYGELPWETMVEPGICGGILDTGVIGPFTERGYAVILGMQWDDSRAMLGWLGTLLFCSTR